MINYANRNTEGTEDTQRTQRDHKGFPVYRLLVTVYRLLTTDYRFLLLIIPLLYLFTLARTPVLGDPTEYTVVANTLGVAHPPGYAFITVVGKLFQTLIPFGSVAWRMHLLSAVSGTLAALFVYGTVRALKSPISNLQSLSAVFAALTVGTAVNHWQHAIHANPHIITATFTAANLYFLTRWWAEKQRNRGAEGQGSSGDKWLYVFSLSAGLGVTHHPLTVFGFPAYALFILAVWWQQSRAIANRQFFRRWPTILKMLGFALLGLSVWLYFPLRSANAPLGATGLNTVQGFLNHILARGLSDTLPFYSLSDQPTRLVVFWSILRLQFSLPTIFLAVIGVLFSLFPPRMSRRLPRLPILLYLITFLSFYAFVISLRVQDIMAYLLGPLLLIGLFAGLGLWQLLALVERRLQVGKRTLALLATAVFLLGPVLQILRNAPVISLSQYSEGQDYVDAVFDSFDGSGAGATLLNDWEHMTPLWYSQFVDGRWPNEDDVQLLWVSAGTANPWLEAVFRYLPGGSVYLSNYRREIVDAGFRLRPFGPFYQVVEPGDTSLPPELTPTHASGEEINIVGYALGNVECGMLNAECPPPATSYQLPTTNYLPITLAMTAPITPTDYYVPVIHVGEINFTFTTDSHLLTPTWLPGEVVVERFDVALPFDLPGGAYPVTLDLKDLSTDTVVPLNLALGTVIVAERPYPPHTNHLLANFRQRVGLVSATASNGLGERRVVRGDAAPWMEPIDAQPGDTIDLNLRWQSIWYAEESYTVFVHLIDLANRPYVTLDYTPLGGSVPTYLWFAKWLPGQQFLDPYHLTIPDDLPPGQYLIEVGLYEMVGKRRLHISDAQGNLVGDRYILGSVIVGE
ncbi:MAG: DUF2723 domain-containing protein [Ardenticatenaceae bacterium]|nr:DUF2723 domain-containing protein [Ardenticatenaceae bacterium]